MKTNSLQLIQVLAKIGNILSKIVYICSIIGTIGCAVGLAAFGTIQGTLKIGSITLHGLVEESVGMNMGNVYASMAVGLILCFGEIFLSRIAVNYFKHELDDGTPFTLRGAKELLHLGISCIWIPIVTTIVAAIVHSILGWIFEDVSALNLDNYTSVGLGIAFIVGSVLCKYGAELNGSSNFEEV